MKQIIIKNKKDITKEIIGISPFYQSLEIKVKTHSSKRRQVDVSSISLDEDVISYGNVISIEETVEIENETYTKTYNSQLLRIHILNLSSRARDLCLWITYSLKPGKDYLYFNKARVLKELNISKNTYSAAIKDLIKDSVISQSPVKDVYWVNPLFFFNGSRAKLYPEKILKT